MVGMRSAMGVLACAAGLVSGGDPVLPANGGFADGLSGWSLAPGPASGVTIEACPEAGGHAAHLRAEGSLLGLDSAPLAFGRDLDPGKAYAVHGRLRFGGLQSGIAAFTVCLLDAAGRRLEQIAVQSWSVNSRAHGWVTRTLVVGPGTAHPFPEGACSLHLRVSFHEREGNCRGDVWAGGFRIEEHTPAPFEAWPDEVVVECGDLGVRFERRSFWTLYRIDYRGVRLCRDQFGSHYGSVANFPGTGFIGSGHTENGETEVIVDLVLDVDGVAQSPPLAHYRAARVRLRKESRLRGLLLRTEVEVADGRIVERVAMRAEKPTELSLIYHFMHPWVTEMSDFLALGLDGTERKGVFDGDGGMKVAVPVAWSAVYGRGLGKGAVTAIIEAPPGSAWNVRYWDVPERYRKHYLMAFAKATVPAGPEFVYGAVTVPFEAAADTWEATARALGSACHR